MSKYIKKAKDSAKLLPIKKQIEFLNSQLDEKSEVFNEATFKLVKQAVKFEAFSIKLIDIHTIVTIDEESGEEIENKILVTGKTSVFDRENKELVSSEVYVLASKDEKGRFCFTTDSILDSFYYKYAEQIEAFEKAEQEAEKKQKAEQKEAEQKAKKEAAEQKKLETALKLEEAKKQKRIEKAEQVMQKAEQMKQEAKASIEALKKQQPAEKQQQPAEKQQQQPKDMTGKPNKQKPAEKKKKIS